jgi:hypothetical protein
MDVPTLSPDVMLIRTTPLGEVRISTTEVSPCLIKRGKWFRHNVRHNVTSTMQEFVDIAIATLYAGNFIKDWNVTAEVSCSDYRYIRFAVTGIDRSPEVYRNPRRTDWESFRTNLPGYLCSMTDKVDYYMGLEIASTQFQDAIVSDYNNSCPFTARGTPGT